MSQAAVAGLSLETVLYEKKGSFAYITMNRPKVLNALNSKALADLRAALQDAKDDPEVLGAIITGAGEKAFIAGADINEVATDTPVEAEQKTRRGQAVMDLIENLGKPAIAAVNGFALGGGCETALACTLQQRTPEPGILSAGQRVFESTACVNCHAISGTSARGRFGPDLTHLMSRDTIAAGAARNTPEMLRLWVRSPDAIKPGSKMPAMGLNDSDLDALTAYLETLR